jgi:hypothetical protein
MLTQAKVLASKKDIAALETFSNTEVLLLCVCNGHFNHEINRIKLKQCDYASIFIMFNIL